MCQSPQLSSPSKLVEAERPADARPHFALRIHCYICDSPKYGTTKMFYILLTLLSPSEVLHGPAPCTKTPLAEICHTGEQCHPDNKLCPPVTTEPSCGEVPHSGRDGAVLAWGISNRARSAQECCDKCKSHSRQCNSWTFCGLPVCWGLDTGHNHTYGEVRITTLYMITPLI